MTTKSLGTSQRTTHPPSPEFQAGYVLTIAGAHLFHDTFASFLVPLLPLIIEKLGLSLALAGSLAAFRQLPSLANPLIGLLADRVSLRYFVILAPAVTATAMSLIGVAPGYTVLVILLFVAGTSTAAFHVPAPPMIAHISGSKVGRGMSVFMMGGELARMLGPLVAVGAASLWGLEGIYRLMPLGILASCILYWRLKDVPAQPRKPQGRPLAQTWQEVRGVLLPASGIMVSRSFMTAALIDFLPTLLSLEGSSLWFAGASLSILELAGALGALTVGTVSDRIGRRLALLIATGLSPLLMLAFLGAKGGTLFPVLIALGFTVLSTPPVMMALVQEHAIENPATANGIYMAMSFLTRSLIVLVVGYMADRVGLRPAFSWCALLSIGGLPFVFFLPKKVRSTVR